MVKIKIPPPVKLVLTILRYLPSAVLLHIVIFITIIVFTPFAIFRRIIFYAARIFKPKLEKMLNLDAVLYVSGYREMAGNILLELRLDGQVDINQFKADFTEKLLNCKKPGSDELLYPELRQNYTKWLGYLFWTNYENFSIHEHIGYWAKQPQIAADDDEKTQLTKLNQIRKEILLITFLHHKPLWYWYIIPNPKANCTHLFFKIHHVMADGFSITKSLSQMFPISEEDKKYYDHLRFLKENYKMPNIFARAGFLMSKILFTPIKLTQLVSIIWRNRMDWQKNIRKDDFYMENAEDVPLGQSKEIQFEDIKKTARLHGTNPSNVILAAICGGLRNYMVETGAKMTPNPVCGTPNPTMIHSDKLRNAMYTMSLPFPMAEECAKRRLEKITKRKQTIRDKTFIPQFGLFIFQIICNLPDQLFGPLFILLSGGRGYKAVDFPIFYTGFPGPKSTSWRDHKTHVVGFTVCAFVLGLPLLITSVSNKNGLTFFGVGLKSIFKDDEGVNRLFKLIENEFDILADFKNIEDTQVSVV